MGIAPEPSMVVLPKDGSTYKSIFDFLVDRFNTISKETWIKRIESNRVVDQHKEPITCYTPYEPLKRIFYYREVDNEITIPFKEKVLFQNDHILMVDKPHFLPVVPAGKYVNECLLYRLKQRTGIKDLSPINRIDRETAGLVLFSTNKETRGLYQNLFMQRAVEKEYHATAHCSRELTGKEWLIKNRIVRGEPWFRMKMVEGAINACTKIHLLSKHDSLAQFSLFPITGKKHQLRLHLSLLGCQIVHDRYYPTLQPKRPIDFNKPLQLLAKRVAFADPIENVRREFISTLSLMNLNSVQP